MVVVDDDDDALLLLIWSHKLLFFCGLESSATLEMRLTTGQCCNDAMMMYNNKQKLFRHGVPPGEHGDYLGQGQRVEADEAVPRHPADLALRGEANVCKTRAHSRTHSLTHSLTRSLSLARSLTH